MTICSFAAAALAQNVAAGFDMADPMMVLLAGGSMSSAYAAAVEGRTVVVVDEDEAPVSGVVETVRPGR